MSRTAAAVLTSAVGALLVACGGTPQLISPDGLLIDCSLPRCVSSQSQDPARYIEPIRYNGGRDAARAALQRIVVGMRGGKLVLQTDDYLHFEFTSGLLRQVDDLEMQFPRKGQQVQVRSSSRAGYYDFDQNRERVEHIRTQFEALQP